MAAAAKMTAKARAAFEIYRDMGRDRTLAKTAEQMGYRSQSHIRGWSTKYDWTKLVAEHDHASLKEHLGQRTVVREHALQRMIDNMDAAAGVLLEIMLDRSKLPILDRHGKPELDADGNRMFKYQVKPSTRAQCAEKVLGIGGLAPVKRTEIVDTTSENLDEAAAVLESMHPDDLDAFMIRLRKRNKEIDGAT
jgi:hypothetical protein